MTPTERRSRPAGNGPAEFVEITTTDNPRVPPTVDAMRARRAAASRCAPLEDGTSRRDPLDPMPRDPTPSTFGLYLADRQAHARELRDRWGWPESEIRVRLDLLSEAA